MTDANTDVFLIKLDWCINGGGTEDGNEKEAPAKFMMQESQPIEWYGRNKCFESTTASNLSPDTATAYKNQENNLLSSFNWKNPDLLQERAGYCAGESS